MNLVVLIPGAPWVECMQFGGANANFGPQPLTGFRHVEAGVEGIHPETVEELTLEEF